MAQVKYLAAGFLNDAEKLLQDFIHGNSLEFSAFVKIWKKRNFSLICALRPHERELREFTQEIFNITIDFLNDKSLFYQVGGVFLLYALYRNQILKSPVKIRLTPEQFEIISTLRGESSVCNNRSFYYVVKYLIKNSFYFVACPSVMGPSSASAQETRKKEYIDSNPLDIEVDTLESDLMELIDSNIINRLDESFARYQANMAMAKYPVTAVSDCQSRPFKTLAVQIKQLLNCTATSSKITTGVMSSFSNDACKGSIGSRRAQLKAAAFAGSVSMAHEYRTMLQNYPATSCISESESALELPSNPNPPVRKIAIRKKKKRVPKYLRKVGRPKKYASDESSDEWDLNPVEVVAESSQPGVRKRRAPRDTGLVGKRRSYIDKDVEDVYLKFKKVCEKFLPQSDESSLSSDGSESSLRDCKDVAFSEKKDKDSLFPNDIVEEQKC
ncbi:uncharacterized protein CDAR_123021 [Caerostris darwini]|uniref:snRNA-activating protein complex subunit 1 n=1 Tax=Caerostris darwini TaxID=1538125 RepID=A0AAV4NAV1_9ARAC|nr:uncharacterized protein CDAR_123021 [Caerostris darwini]